MTMGVEVLMGRKQSQAGTRGVKTAEGSVMGCGGHLVFVNWKTYMFLRIRFYICFDLKSDKNHS